MITEEIIENNEINNDFYLEEFVSEKLVLGKEIFIKDSSDFSEFKINRNFINSPWNIFKLIFNEVLINMIL